MFTSIRNFFIAKRLSSTEDVFEKAKINLVFYFTFFMSFLAIPFLIQLYIKGFWFHFGINLFEAFSLAIIYGMFRSNLSLKTIGITFVLMDSIMSAGSLIFQNGHFEIQAGLWSMLLIIYTFFVLGKQWGLCIVVFVALLYIGCIEFDNGQAFLNFEIPANQILPTESGFVFLPFLLNIYIITVFINTSINAENLMRIQKQKLELQKNEILASITYAQRIQNAILPQKQEISSVFPDSFVLFKPKDIVSGDFYYFNVKNGLIFLAVADSTGHGVPGALMSMIGSEILNDSVHKNTNTSEILSLLNQGVKASLRQTESDHSTRDGLDIGLWAINLKENKLMFSGANRPLWIIRDNQNFIEEIKPTKKAIGGFTDINQAFLQNEITIQKGDCIYCFTDGYVDQFNGISGKKIMTKRFRELLISIKDSSMPEQEKSLTTFFENWQGNSEQIDDVLVFGIRI